METAEENERFFTVRFVVDDDGRLVEYGRRPAKDGTVAVLLEVLPGFFLQTFGIGNIYAGNVGAGIALMLGYWVLTTINVFLCLVFVGFITYPLTFIAFMILAPVMAKNACERA